MRLTSHIRICIRIRIRIRIDTKIGTYNSRTGPQPSNFNP
jgi:hypothetical protein